MRLARKAARHSQQVSVWVTCGLGAGAGRYNGLACGPRKPISASCPCAQWTAAHDLIVEVLYQPTDHHTHKKNHVRRYLGYGAVDAGVALDCATDRATLWAVGNLQREQSHTFSVPLPAIMSGKAQLHGLATTVAW